MTAPTSTAPTSTPPLSVHVWSDVACPWCFIGKTRLERAVAQLEAPVEVVFHSFELSPDTPVDFEGSVTDYLAHRKGMSHEQVTQMFAQVSGLATAEGLSIDFAAVQHTRTLKAHELLQLAKTRGLQAQTAHALFSAYFEQGRHIGHEDELVAIAEEVGLDGEEARSALAEGTFAQAVQQDIDAAVGLGIRGVPFFVIDERYGISGAQPVETMLAALRQALEERSAPAAV